jgi:hypothetical protein
MGRANREASIPGLPVKGGCPFRLLFHPFGRFALEFPDQDSDLNRFAQTAEDMYVVFYPTDSYRWTFQVSASANQIGVQSTPERFVGQQRLAVFGRENQVQVNLSQRLRHDAAPGMKLILEHASRNMAACPEKSSLTSRVQRLRRKDKKGWRLSPRVRYATLGCGVQRLRRKDKKAPISLIPQRINWL